MSISPRVARSDRIDDSRGHHRSIGPLVGAALFLAAYLAVSPVATPLQGAPLPLPGAPADVVYHYLTSSGQALVATAALQGLSVCGLAVFLTRPAVRAVSGRSSRSVLALASGGTAIAAMLVTVGLSAVLGTSAASLTVDTALQLRAVSFLGGGVVHVVALGVLAALLSRSAGWSRPVRIFGLVAAVPAVLSVFSTVFFYASPLLPVGRLLVMVWLVIAALSLLRGRSRASVS